MLGCRGGRPQQVGRRRGSSEAAARPPKQCCAPQASAAQPLEQRQQRGRHGSQAVPAKGTSAQPTRRTAGAAQGRSQAGRARGVAFAKRAPGKFEVAQKKEASASRRLKVADPAAAAHGAAARGISRAGPGNPAAPAQPGGGGGKRARVAGGTEHGNGRSRGPGAATALGRAGRGDSPPHRRQGTAALPTGQAAMGAEGHDSGRAAAAAATSSHGRNGPARGCAAARPTRPKADHRRLGQPGRGASACSAPRLGAQREHRPSHDRQPRGSKRPGAACKGAQAPSQPQPTWQAPAARQRQQRPKRPPIGPVKAQAAAQRSSEAAASGPARRPCPSSGGPPAVQHVTAGRALHEQQGPDEPRGDSQQMGTKPAEEPTRKHRKCKGQDPILKRPAGHGGDREGEAQQAVPMQGPEAASRPPLPQCS